MTVRHRLVALIVGGMCLLTGMGIVISIAIWPSKEGPEYIGGQAVRPATVTTSYPDFCEVFSRGSNPYVGEKPRDKLLELLGNSDRGDNALRAELYIRLAEEELKFGDTDEAIRLLQAVISEGEGGVPDSQIRAAEHALAVANLRKGELENCLRPDGRFACILPLGGQGHRYPGGAEAAIDTLERLLEADASDLRAMWLFNIAHMNLGTYPDQVPPGLLIPPSAFGEEGGLAPFTEIGPEAGIFSLNTAGGVIVDDFDNDGLFDVIVSTWDPCGSLTYFHNDGNGLFSDYSLQSGLDQQFGGLNIVQTDYNNDGWLDVLVIRGGWMQGYGRMPMSLLHNNGDNTFTDVTGPSGLGSPAIPRNSATWADFDLDGDLDLFACGESEPDTWIGDPSKGGSAIRYPSQLYRNNGDGTFIDIALSAGVTNDRYCKGSAWGDYDNDGDPDLYVSNFRDDNRLYRNLGDGTFVDVAPALGATGPLASFATWFWDFDNNGCLDIFVAGYGFDIEDVAADRLGLASDGSRPALYKSDCDGNFSEVAETAGVADVNLTMGANFGDFDNDGFLDFMLGTGFVSYDSLGPNVAYRNTGDGYFENLTKTAGLGHLQKGHGIGFADLDRDGDQDIFVQLGGFYRGDSALSALYDNPGHGNRWITLKLVGEESNRVAIGARIEVNFRDPEGNRRVYLQVDSGGSFGSSSLEQEIGLGDATEIISVTVRWPSGRTETFLDLPLDTRFVISEGRGLGKVELPSFVLGSP